MPGSTRAFCKIGSTPLRGNSLFIQRHRRSERIWLKLGQRARLGDASDQRCRGRPTSTLILTKLVLSIDKFLEDPDPVDADGASSEKGLGGLINGLLQDPASILDGFAPFEVVSTMQSI